MDEKLCARCKQAPRYKGSYCSDCLKEVRRRSYLRRKEHVLEHGADYYEKNKEARRTYQREYAKTPRRQKYIKDHPELYGSAKYWAFRTRPTTTTVAVRFNIEVMEQEGKWTWVLKTAIGVKISSQESFDTCKGAWDDARDFLKGFRKRIEETNEDFRKESKLEG